MHIRGMKPAQVLVGPAVAEKEPLWSELIPAYQGRLNSIARFARAHDSRKACKNETCVKVVTPHLMPISAVRPRAIGKLAANNITGRAHRCIAQALFVQHPTDRG